MTPKCPALKRHGAQLSISEWAAPKWLSPKKNLLKMNELQLLTKKQVISLIRQSLEKLFEASEIMKINFIRFRSIDMRFIKFARTVRI